MFRIIFGLMMRLWLYEEWQKAIDKREAWERSIPEGSPFMEEPPICRRPPVRRNPRRWEKEDG